MLLSSLHVGICQSSSNTERPATAMHNTGLSPSSVASEKYVHKVAGPFEGLSPPWPPRRKAELVSNKVLDLGHQVFDAAKGAATDRLLGDDVEPDFDLVEPRSIGGRVVHLKPGMRDQPVEHAGVLVRGVVIYD